MRGDIIATPEQAAQTHHQLQREGRLPMWVVFCNTQDYGTLYVARLQVPQGGTPPVVLRTNLVMLGGTADELRAKLPDGLTAIPRDPRDDPKIIETWL